jgi:hypothetical protein
MASIFVTDATKLTFTFSEASGNVTISYPAATDIVASGWRQWYTYISGAGFYFVDGEAPGGAGNTAADLKNHTAPTKLTTSVSPQGGGVISIIGNGDARHPGGYANFNRNIGNATNTATNYVNVEITKTEFMVTYHT